MNWKIIGTHCGFSLVLKMDIGVHPRGRKIAGFDHAIW
jgi:hypothetical protein